MVPIYSMASEDNLKKLHNIIMTAARAAIGSYCFKKSVRYILDKCKWYDIKDLILISSLNTIHKITINKYLPCMTQLFKNPEK